MPCFGGDYLRAQLATKDAEIARLRSALAPVLIHADAPDTAPPLRLSVGDCKNIKNMAENKGEQQ